MNSLHYYLLSNMTYNKRRTINTGIPLNTCAGQAIAFSDEEITNLIPHKSAQSYWNVHSEFLDWANANDINAAEFNQNDALAYLGHLRASEAASTLYKKWSMVSTIHGYRYGVNLKHWPAPKDFLRRFKESTQQKKLELQISTGTVEEERGVFTSEDLQRFQRDASENEFKLHKAMIPFGIPFLQKFFKCLPLFSSCRTSQSV